jgi:hypothetical protein
MLIRRRIKVLLSVLFGRSVRAQKPKPPQNRRRLNIETLEERLTPSNWLVTLATPDSAATAGTLRWAVDSAQNGDTITFSNSLSGDTITLNATLTINHNYTITGLGAGNLSISGNNACEVFSIPYGITSAISGLTIKQGEFQGSGGGGSGIDSFGNLTLNNDAVSNNGFANNTSVYAGGGILNGGTMSIYGCTINGNYSHAIGGGIYNEGSLFASNSTIANNAAYSYGGGIYNTAGELTLYECTVSGNHGWNNNTGLPYYGGGIYSQSGTVYLDTTIVAGNEAYYGGPDIYGTVVEAYYCLIGNTSGLTITSSLNNQLNYSANLGALANNGGTTLTMAPLPGSVAHGNGDPFWAGGSSQNGTVRPVNPDIGACQGRSWVVTDPNGNAGSGSPADVTLPYAVANAQNTDRITFASYLTGDTITLSATLTINLSYTITGLGAANLAVSGNNLVQDFFVNSGVTASISGLTIENGHESDGGGGGILNTGTLTVDSCMISGNNGTVVGTYNPYGSGGGILNTGTLTLTNSTVANNTANFGGGMENYNLSGTATTAINDCTFIGNTGSSAAGVNDYDGGALSLSNSTVAFNNGYGTWVTTMDNCIVAGNPAGANYSGTSGTFTSTSTAGLATTLAYNGGTTPTLKLSAGSPAIGAGDPAQAGTTSQNGLVRPASPDIGAYQSGSAPVFLSIAVNGGTPQYQDAFGNGLAEPIAGQNSVVEQILVTFNEPVTVAPNAFSITPYTISPDGNPGYMEVVVNSGPNPNQVAPILNAPIMVGDGHQWIITFGNNGATTSNGSGFYVLKDGVYSLNIDHTKVSANSQNMAADVGGPGPSSFWALYGDTTFHDISGVDHPGYIGDGYSDASVGNADFQAFKAYYNSDSTNYYAPPNYNVKFDANLDGSIANSDFVQFKTNYNTDWQF